MSTSQRKVKISLASLGPGNIHIFLFFFGSILTFFHLFFFCFFSWEVLGSWSLEMGCWGCIFLSFYSWQPPHWVELSKDYIDIDYNLIIIIDFKIKKLLKPNADRPTLSGTFWLFSQFFQFHISVQCSYWMDVVSWFESIYDKISFETWIATLVSDIPFW